jgi:Ni/Fe-hydrogenase 1 B-type cytochrome subunit
MSAEASNIVRVYVWEWPVRATHWLIVLSIATCAMTGLYIGNPGLAFVGTWNGFTMGTAKVVHFYGAIVFTVSVAARVVWMFIGNNYARWDKFIPVHAKRRRGIMPTLRFYLFALRKPPGFVGHNPVAGLAYTIVFLLYGAMIVTGVALYSASAAVGSPLHPFTFLIPWVGGLQTARWIHHVVMWLLLGFAVHHVYSGLLMTQIEANATMESIFSGFKFVPREDLVYSGYRFIDRQDVPDA